MRRFDRRPDPLTHLTDSSIIGVALSAATVGCVAHVNEASDAIGAIPAAVPRVYILSFGFPSRLHFSAATNVDLSDHSHARGSQRGNR